MLDAHLKGMGYVQSTNDPCIYTLAGGETTIIGVYVDDLRELRKNRASENSAVREVRCKISRSATLLPWSTSRPGSQKGYSLVGSTNLH